MTYAILPVVLRTGKRKWLVCYLFSIFFLFGCYSKAVSKYRYAYNRFGNHALHFQE